MTHDEMMSLLANTLADAAGSSGCLPILDCFSPHPGEEVTVSIPMCDDTVDIVLEDLDFPHEWEELLENSGAGRLDRVKRSVWVTLAIGVIYTLCTGAALLAGQDAILHLFTADEAVVTYGKLAMRWFCPFYFLLSILHGLAGAVRGTGASIPPMVVLLVSLCLFRVVWIQFLLPFFSGIEGVFILYPVSWGLGALLMILYAWKGKWMEYHT
jgi:hypothetical protein